MHIMRSLKITFDTYMVYKYYLVKPFSRNIPMFSSEPQHFSE